MAGLFDGMNLNGYPGGIAGLLANLPQWQQQFPPTQGFGPDEASSVNRPPAMPAAPMQQPQQQQPGFFSQLGTGIGNNSNMLMGMGASLMSGGGFGGGLQGAMMGQQLDQKQRAPLAVKAALLARGMSPDLAEAIALNPKLLETVAPHLLGAKQGIVVNNRLVDPSTGKMMADYSDTSLKAPETKPLEDGSLATWNAKDNRWERVDPGAMPAFGSHSTTPATMTSAASPALSSPISIPAPPVGVNPKKFREESATKTADELATMRDKGLGAIEFLKMSDRAKQLYQAAPEVFGPWTGSSAYNDYLRAPAAAIRDAGNAVIPGAESVSGAGNIYRDNMSKFNQVESATKELSSAGLKARYGARPTNIDLQQNNAMFGGLRSADAKTAIANVERMEREHYDTIEQNVRAGTLDPKQIPPEIVQRGIAIGALDPRSFAGSLQAPAQPAAAQPSRGMRRYNPATGKIE